MEDFPPNSNARRTAAAGEPREPKRVERVTSGEAVRRRPPLGKQFKHTFFGGDAKTATQYMITEVLIPAVKDMIVEAGQSGLERLVHGESSVRPRRGPSPMSGALGHVAYHRMSSQQQPQRPMAAQPSAPRRSRRQQSSDEIVLQSRQEAEDVLDQMFTILERYDEVTLADLYLMTGLSTSHTDHKWGWTNLRGATVGRVRGGGYLLNLPETEPLG